MDATTSGQEAFLTEAPLSEARLAGTCWHYHSSDEKDPQKFLRLLPDGRIGGYSHPNEKTWEVAFGHLRFLSENGTTTVTFDNMKLSDGRLALSGKFEPYPSIELFLDQVSFDAWPRESVTKIHLARQISDFGWTVGDHSYGVPFFFEEESAKVHIGKYCSIATGVHIALGDHRSDYVSSYPFITLGRRWPSTPHGVSDHSTRGDVRIGNDVWIGVNAFIGSGVTIGDGAVIGAHAVVTKDVPPYGVAVGTPAQVVRFRFEAEAIEELLEIAWWSWSDEAVDDALELMMKPDIWGFIKHYRKQSHPAR